MLIMCSGTLDKKKISHFQTTYFQISSEVQHQYTRFNKQKVPFLGDSFNNSAYVQFQT